ncbi:hypothetical protein QZH41_007834 [Actinostola sp. cb2023]|nr:hypothetical protein QZH41_007834 [Actinostola sp. cb2023]
MPRRKISQLMDDGQTVFSLDKLSDVPRYVGQNHYQSILDDKSGYDHLFLTPESRSFFGIEWGGWWFVYNTLPFGWKISPFVYHTTALVSSNWFRSIGIPCSIYIDDRHNGQLQVARTHGAFASLTSVDEYNQASAKSALFIVAYTLIELGYFLGLSKSILAPRMVVPYLGFLVDSSRQAFVLIPEKRRKFLDLVRQIVSHKLVSVKTLQRLVGKCVSLSLAVPGALFFIREMNHAIWNGLRSGRPIRVDGRLKDEIQHWLFLESWDSPVRWRDERHIQVRVTSDASNSGWGGCVSGDWPMEMSDYWTTEEQKYDISIKEALALNKVLLSVGERIRDSWVEAQELPATAKLFVLSVRCPTCGHANDHDFHFCQRCGYRRHVVTSVWRVGKEVDVDTIDRRLDQLTVWDQSTNYAKRKDSLQRSLETFLSSLPGRPSIHTGSPRDICRILVYKDKDGRTQVHRNGCRFLGQRGIQACGCPLRLAYNTVDSYIGKLRSIFHAVGREGEWDRRLGLGNPAAGKVVKDYLRLVTAEQLQARISPRQAMPFFVDKLVQLSNHLHKALESPGVTPLQRFILARDQAYLKAVFFSGDRPGDMGQGNKSLGRSLRGLLQEYNTVGTPGYPSPLDRIRGGKDERAKELGILTELQDSMDLNATFPKMLRQKVFKDEDRDTRNKPSLQQIAGWISEYLVD